MIEINGISYEFVVASDVQRDGLGIELWDSPQTKILGEIFRNDANRSIDFYIDKAGLPLEIIEELIKRFNLRVGRVFQDDITFE